MDRVRVEAAKMILSGPSCLLYKACRAGATTSLAIAAGEMNKSMLLIAPTNAIIDKTLRRACRQEPVKIAANVACYKWKEAIREDRFLANLPLPIQNCGECEYYPNCEVTEILRFDRKPGTGINFGITYHKLAAVMLAKSDTSRAIRDKLRGLDAIVLDEAHLISLHQPPRVPVFSYPDIPEEFTSLNGVLVAFQDQCHQSIEIIKGI
jgi:predicted helicase